MLSPVHPGQKGTPRCRGGGCPSAHERGYAPGTRPGTRRKHTAPRRRRREEPRGSRGQTRDPLKVCPHPLFCRRFTQHQRLSSPAGPGVPDGQSKERRLPRPGSLRGRPIPPHVTSRHVTLEPRSFPELQVASEKETRTPCVWPSWDGLARTLFCGGAITAQRNRGPLWASTPQPRGGGVLVRGCH